MRRGILGLPAHLIRRHRRLARDADRRQKRVTVIDGSGNPLTIDQDLLPDLIMADHRHGPHRADHDSKWILDANGMRAVISMAQSCDTIEDALLTIVANTRWSHDETDET